MRDKILTSMALKMCQRKRVADLFHFEKAPVSQCFFNIVPETLLREIIFSLLNQRASEDERSGYALTLLCYYFRTHLEFERYGSCSTFVLNLLIQPDASLFSS